MRTSWKAAVLVALMSVPLSVARAASDQAVEAYKKYLAAETAGDESRDALLAKAAELEHPDAMWRMSVDAETAKDLATQEKFMLKAAQAGHPLAQLGMSDLEKDRKNTAKWIEWLLKTIEHSPEELPPEDPVYCLRSAFPFAYYEAGMAYLKGEGVPKDEAKAKTWLEKAAKYDVQEAKDALTALSGGAPASPSPAK